jgi:tryptophan halogenase
MEGVRDFIILHYHLNARQEPFWRRQREMGVPDSLAERLALFAEAAQAYQGPEELFRVTSWMQVLLGQGVVPASHHHLARLMSVEQLSQALAGLGSTVDAAVNALPSHQAFIESYCRETPA